MCCEPHGFDDENLIDGECPECGNPTVDGEAFDVCGYSPIICDTCGCAPCDQSC
jgi:hypothetical protein